MQWTPVTPFLIVLKNNRKNRKRKDFFLFAVSFYYFLLKKEQKCLQFLFYFALLFKKNRDQILTNIYEKRRAPVLPGKTMSYTKRFFKSVLLKFVVLRFISNGVKCLSSYFRTFYKKAKETISLELLIKVNRPRLTGLLLMQISENIKTIWAASPRLWT